MPLLIILAVVTFIVVFLISFFNHLRAIQIQIQASIQEIGNQLKRQSDLIPNLVESVKGYMKHEKDIFTSLTDARRLINRALETKNPEQINKAQESIGKIIKDISIIVESNPEIKASQVVENLMNELRDTADKVTYARRLLIDLTADFNTTISTIPGVWIAPIMGFKTEKGLSVPTAGKFLEVSEEETQKPSVKI
ncbi:MAG: LemA family protein [Candidatus Shapirobacteria bacterium]|jgi:LemA protein